jgi:hypothetical protein
MDETTLQSSDKGGSKKTLAIIAVIVVLLILGGGGYFLMGKNKTAPASTTMAPKASPTSSNMFSSIQDALSKSLSLQCNFSDGKTGIQTIAYLKAGAIRGDVTGKTPDQNSSFIMKDKKMYFWNGKKGMMMAFDPSQMMKALPSTSPATQKDTGTSQNGTSMIEQLEKFKESCKPSTVADALFVPPTNVTFQDLSKMMPSGAMMPKTSPVPSGMSQEQIQQMQKQMMDKYKPSGQ